MSESIRCVCESSTSGYTRSFFKSLTIVKGLPHTRTHTHTALQGVCWQLVGCIRDKRATQQVSCLCVCVCAHFLLSQSYVELFKLAPPSFYSKLTGDLKVKLWMCVSINLFSLCIVMILLCVSLISPCAVYFNNTRRQQHTLTDTVSHY